MIVQDSQTGTLHQVPDQVSGYGEYGDVVYDGLGNPVGRLAGIFDDIGKFVGSAVSAIPGVGPLVAPLVNRFLPGGAAAPPTPPLPIPGLPTPTVAMPPLPIPGLPTPSFPLPGGFPSFRPPWPAGWVRPPLPYTGLGPKRLYMRCAVWPGPRDLVPGYAQNAVLPGVPPGAPPMAAQYHRRHHHRRR